jgi:hypothetical protein
MTKLWRGLLAAEEIPTSDIIARAIVAAARVLGEDPLDAAPDPDRPRPKAVKVAFHVVREFYPHYPASRLGPAMGLGHIALQHINAAKKLPWWTKRRDAFAAAADAVEAA